MAKLSDNQLSNINIQLQELPSFGDLNIENTENGLEISGNDMTDDELSSLSELILLDDTFEKSINDNVLTISSKLESTNERLNRMLKESFINAFIKRDKKSLDKIDSVLESIFLGKCKNVEKSLQGLYESEDDGVIELKNGTIKKDGDKIIIDWIDGQQYMIDNSDGSVDTDKLSLILDNADDIASIIDDLNDVGYVLDINENNNTDFTKDEFHKIAEFHNVTGKKLDKNKINKSLAEFNKSFKNFIIKHPDFEIFGNDYNGEVDDEFVELLVNSLEQDNIKIY